jgi:hypothetical protein
VKEEIGFSGDWDAGLDDLRARLNWQAEQGYFDKPRQQAFFRALLAKTAAEQLKPEV